MIFKKFTYFHRLEEKLKLTQRLLDKLDKEFEFKSNQNRDFKHFLEKSSKSFEIYELCANEFCFELELLQFPVISLFFKRFIEGYHKQFSCFLKIYTENPRFHQKNEIIAQIMKNKPNEDSEDDPETPKKINDLYGNFDKINDLTKQNQRKTSVLQDTTMSKKDVKFQQSNILLRNELSNMTQNNEMLLKQTQQLRDMVSKIEKEKKGLEEELIRTVKSNIFNQNINISMHSSTLRPTQNNKENIEESKNMEEFLKGLKKTNEKQEISKEKTEEKNNIQSDNAPIKMNEKEQKENDDDEVNIAEMKMLLEKKDKTFEKFKESGVSKELKLVLKEISKKKHGNNIKISSIL